MLFWPNEIHDIPNLDRVQRRLTVKILVALSRNVSSEESIRWQIINMYLYEPNFRIKWSFFDAVAAVLGWIP